MADTIFRAVLKDGAFHPYLRHRRQIRQEFKEGEHVYLEIQHERSMASHKHQFAFVNNAYDSLPERLGNAPFAVSAEALRKHALISKGFCEVKTINAGSHAAAERVAAAVKPMADEVKGYSVVDVEGPLVIVRTPLSQSMRAMGKDQFERSKEAVLAWLSDLLEVSPEELRKSTDEPDHREH